MNEVNYYRMGDNRKFLFLIKTINRIEVDRIIMYKNHTEYTKGNGCNIDSLLQCFPPEEITNLQWIRVKRLAVARILKCNG